MTSGISSVKYPELEQIAASFESESQFVAALRQRIEDQLGGLRAGGWIADAAFEFLRTMDSDVLVGIVRLERALLTASLVVHDTRRIFLDAEFDAASLLDQAMSAERTASEAFRDLLILTGLTAINPLYGAGYALYQLNRAYGLDRILSQFTGQLFDTSGTTGFHFPQAGLDFGLSILTLGLGGHLPKDMDELTKALIDFAVGASAGEFSRLLRGDGRTLETLTESVIASLMESGTEVGIDLLTGSPAGTILMLVNDGHQVIGSGISDMSLLYRNLLTAVAGGDTSGVWYGNMTDSVNAFYHQIEESDLSNLFDSLAGVAYDGYFRPVFDRVGITLQNPTLDNIAALTLSLAGRMTPLTSGLTIMAEQLGNPEYLNRTLTSVAEFMGTAADTTVALTTLPGTYVEHAGNMGLATLQYLAHNATGLDPNVRAALLDFAHQQYSTVDQIAETVNRLVGGAGAEAYYDARDQYAGTPAETLFQGNLSETLPDLAKPYIDSITDFVDKSGIDDVVHFFFP